MTEDGLDRGFYSGINGAKLPAGDLFTQQGFGRCSECGSHAESYLCLLAWQVVKFFTTSIHLEMKTEFVKPMGSKSGLCC